jgi:hypothetical protein
MTPKRPVKVFWYPAEERGRKVPPSGPKYYGVFKFKPESGPGEDWSVLLEMPPRSDHLYCRDAMLSFVSDQAPFSALRPGDEFFLFEGRWPVAEGVVVQATEAEA